MVSTVKKCAIKRTAKSAGIWTLGIGIGTVAFLCIVSILSFIIESIAAAFPDLGTVFGFLILTAVIAVILLMSICGVHETYKRHIRECEEKVLMRGRDKL